MYNQSACYLFSTVKATTSKWAYLRDGFVRRRRIVGAALPSGSGYESLKKRDMAKQWPYYSLMETLMARVTQERRMATNMDSQNIAVEFVDNQAFGSTSSVINSQPAGSGGRRHHSRSTPSPLEGQTPQSKRQLQQQQQSTAISEVIDLIKSRRVVRDEYDSFGEVVAHALRGMPAERSGRLRFKIAALLFGDGSADVE
ncbi:hypothetical protein FJT64_009694 [Amphibalanus amphitrite]|uniref:MADF domain-containing protein n=1 Tax=Amphibalanus amphitrite TaxID=1232801 RepID=A0A6A4VCR8_AMPAM|nr:hypothetical protein FJT64_009694 [Amphibalanus amphitrite]